MPLHLTPPTPPAADEPRHIAIRLPNRAAHQALLVNISQRATELAVMSLHEREAGKRDTADSLLADTERLLDLASQVRAALEVAA